MVLHLKYNHVEIRVAVSLGLFQAAVPDGR